MTSERIIAALCALISSEGDGSPESDAPPSDDSCLAPPFTQTASILPCSEQVQGHDSEAHGFGAEGGCHVGGRIARRRPVTRDGYGP